jgi:hypothetical protein
MTIARHRDFRLQKLRLGREQAPLVVIDNLVADPEDLVSVAVTKQFGEVASYYPGVRAKVSLSYQQFILEQLRGVFAEEFAFESGAVRFTACHYSLVTMPPEKLTYLQRIPYLVVAKRTRFRSIQSRSRRNGVLPAPIRIRRPGPKT